MSSKGTITADIIKKAMFKAANDIEGRYSKMPKTIGDYWTLMKNKATQAFTPVIEKVSALINTPQFQTFFDNLCVGIQIAADAVNFLVNGFVWLCDVMQPFAPIIWGIIGALIAYKTYTMLAAAGQAFLNAVMTLNPTGLIIAALMALIVILTYLWFTNDKVAYGILYLWDMLVIGAMTLKLGAVTAFYAIIVACLYMYQGILGVKMGVQTAFYMMKLGAQTLQLGFETVAQGIVNAFIWMYNQVAQLLNKLGGNFDTINYADFTSKTVNAMSDTMAEYANAVLGTYGEMEGVNGKISEYQTKLNDLMNNGATEIQNKVISSERTRQDRVNNRNNWIGDLQNKINGKLDTGNATAKFGNNSIPIKADGGKLDKAGEVNISDEDLKYMKDFAEQEFVNKFTTATLAPNITMQFGDIHETADAEKVKDRIKQILEEELSEVAEGVYD